MQNYFWHKLFLPIHFTWKFVRKSVVQKIINHGTMVKHVCMIFLSTKTAMNINFNYLHTCQIDENMQ